jgi:hypothetical protein
MFIHRGILITAGQQTLSPQLVTRCGCLTARDQHGEWASETVGLASMDEAGNEPEDRSATEPYISGSDGVEARCENKQILDVKPEAIAKDRPGSVSSNVFIRFHAVAGNLGRYLWRQATDVLSPNWPPEWLIVSGVAWVLFLVILISWLVIAVLVPTLIKICVALGLTASVLLSEANWTQLWLKPVHSYLDTHSTGLPFSSVQFFSFWIVFGILLFYSSRRGSVGGRIGWALFGIETSGMVWGGTTEPSRWLATGFTVASWSLLSILAYRNKTSSSATTRRKWRFPEFLAIIERRAEENARVLGYADLAHYLDDKANQPDDVIAMDLGILSRHVPELLRRRFPHGVPIRGKLSPKDQREIARRVLTDGESQAELARHFNVSASTISRVIKPYKSRQENKEVQSDEGSLS